MRTATVDIDTLARAIYSNTQASEQEARAFIETSLVVSPSVHRQASAEEAPIDMVLFCPKCGLQHVDAPEKHDRLLCDTDPPAAWSMPPWKNEPHRSHLCHGCRHIWRPADVPTNGVAAVKTKGQADSAIATSAPQSRQASAGQEGDVEPEGMVLVAYANPVILLPADESDPNVEWTAMVQGDKDSSFSLPLFAPAQAVLDTINSIVRDVSESEVADLCDVSALSIREEDLRLILERHVPPAAALSTAAPESGWIDVKERMPSCDGETMFIGENDAGYIACFNELTPDGYCMHATAEGSICVMSGLRHWSRVNRPAAPTAGETL